MGMNMIPVPRVESIRVVNRGYRIKLTCGHKVLASTISGDDQQVYTDDEVALDCFRECPYDRCVVVHVSEAAGVAEAVVALEDKEAEEPCSKSGSQ